jgi:D-arabinose 1-dehydrogenase-like Zn-dependent alcohol dehydrogenase
VRISVVGCAVSDGESLSGQAGRVPGGELVGVVAEAGGECSLRAGQAVLAPRVLSCGECDWCRRGNDAVCPRRLLPGVDVDGGLASEVVLPSRPLCLLDEGLRPADDDLWTLAALVHGVALPYQALARLAMAPGQLVTVVGAGAIGLLTAQLVRAKGGVPLLLSMSSSPPLEALWRCAREDGITVLSQMRLDATMGDRLTAVERELEVRPGPRLVVDTLGTPAATALAVGLAVGGGAVAMTRCTDNATQLSLATLLHRQVTVLAIPYAHPELLTELAALVARGELTFAVRGTSLLRPLPLQDAGLPIELEGLSPEAPFVPVVVTGTESRPLPSDEL